MENFKNLPPFYVGQTIVCIRDHSQGVIVKGQKFKVHGIQKNACCGEWVVDIGFENPYTRCRCAQCDVRYHSSVMLFKHSMFSPIQEQKYPLISLSKVIEKEKELVSAN